MHRHFAPHSQSKRIFERTLQKSSFGSEFYHTTTYRQSHPQSPASTTL
jgi:hypothetical protein